ncbi:HTH-type transcriptional regulator DmlR [Vibrio aerogenes CECT 7868]|uniref:HTH-type transcriptional regulator DmlR n=1 Tax=Vibrio aerogenes CECT 7868 TaxID=1216006 RepID=A0A1M6DFG7_9VIBR|nr:LysR substrate-binding domain-containing protein [Vibrio aerogenes]SHI71799.1 HTH-type transcriptional regulator DmlR [Vibrio aerogenes CECT 7868]
MPDHVVKLIYSYSIINFFFMLTSKDIEFFITIAASRSLAAAARKMNVTPPGVSQRLQQIERKLGVVLAERNARSISLTAEGELLARQGQHILTELENLQQDVSDAKQAISGSLKIVSPLGLGISHIGPLVAEFQRRYPAINVELNLSDAPKWSAHHSPDIMLYIGHLEDSSLKRVVLAKNRRLLLASPAYIQSAPNLNHPRDLAHHRCIALRENDEDATMWRFTDRTNLQTLSVRIAPVLSSNVGQVTKNWCLSGQGIIQRSEWDVRSEIQSGALTELIPGYRLADADIVALMSSDRFRRPGKITVFLGFLQQYLPARLNEDQAGFPENATGQPQLL